MKSGQNRKGEILQAFLEQTDRAAGVDRPEASPSFCSCADQLHAVAIENRIARMGDKRAVEIGADELDFSGHRERQLASPDRQVQTHLTMKSAYELAMERLEKNAPTVA